MPPDSGIAFAKYSQCCLDWWLEKRGTHHCCISSTLAVEDGSLYQTTFSFKELILYCLHYNLLIRDMLAICSSLVPTLIIILNNNNNNKKKKKHK